MVTKMKNNKNLEEEKIEWKKLWEVTIWNKKFAGVEKHKQPKINSCHHYFSKDLKKLVSEKGEIKILTTNFSNVFADEEEVKTNISEGEIICIPGGGNPIVQYYNGKFITGDNKIATSYDKNKLNNKYLYYYLIHNIKLISEMYRGGTIKHPDMTKILEIQIPLPPLKKQAKIAAVLDKFTELTEELTEELTAREAQYEYYRDMLLSEDYLNKILSKKNLIKKQLNEIAKLKRGKRLVRKELEKEGKYPVFQNSLTPLGYYNRKNNDGGKTCIISAGSAGEIFYQKKDFWAADDVFVIVSDSVLNKYLYYYLINKQNLIKTNIRKGTISRLPKEVLENLEILIPPIEIQNEIVNILDNFETLVNDIRQGLPREIELRQKQYEYYREKLLTFE